MVREYTFPSVTLESRIGDVVEFRLKVLNSYDATNAFRALMGGRRRLCLNGLVGREQHTLVTLVYARHTTGFSSERAVEGIRHAMERYLSLDVEWKRWAERIQALMGHASINVTMDVYGHLMPQGGDQVADRLGALVFGASGSKTVAALEAEEGEESQPIVSYDAGERNRTPDLLITNQLLYRLSYTGVNASIFNWVIL